MDSTIEDDSHKPLLLNSPTTAGTVASIFCSRNPVIHPPEETAGGNSSLKVSSNSLQASKDEQLKDILTKKHSISRELHYHPNTWFWSLAFHLLSSGCLLLGVDSLSVEELKEYREYLLLHIYNASETLVGLLQDRCRLHDEVHFRLISIEQLHRLLEARCFFRGLSTGLIS